MASRRRSHSTLDVPELRAGLLRWYETAKRDLPWRRTSDPYRIWVSEIMLQQTRVEAVRPFYENFLRRFPSVRALAKADEQEVLSAWSGLGYYSRARNLRRAAQLLIDRHGGRFPDDQASALALPGVGRYTAAAVLSIAYGIPLAVLDGNVARVLSRIFALRGDVREPKARATLWERAQKLLDTGSAGDFNQAMMELGATVCLPVQPRCNECPVKPHCAAHQRGEERKFSSPVKREREAVFHLVGAIVRDRAGRYLLERRAGDSRWMAGFWQIPTWESPNQAITLGSHQSGLREHLRMARAIGVFRHTITRYPLHVSVHEAELHNARALNPRKANFLWADYSELKHLPVTTIARKAVKLTQASAARRS